MYTVNNEKQFLKLTNRLYNKYKDSTIDVCGLADVPPNKYPCKIKVGINGADEGFEGWSYFLELEYCYE